MDRNQLVVEASHGGTPIRTSRPKHSGIEAYKQPVLPRSTSRCNTTTQRRILTTTESDCSCQRRYRAFSDVVKTKVGRAEKSALRVGIGREDLSRLSNEVFIEE